MLYIYRLCLFTDIDYIISIYILKYMLYFQFCVNIMFSWEICILHIHIDVVAVVVDDDGGGRKHDWKIIFMKHDVIHVLCFLFCSFFLYINTIYNISFN